MSTYQSNVERELRELATEIRNLSHMAWFDKPNIESIFRMIELRAEKLSILLAAPGPEPLSDAELLRKSTEPPEGLEFLALGKSPAAAPAEAEKRRAPDVRIEAFWRDEVWQVEIDYHKDHSGFACKEDLTAALNEALVIALENYKWRRDKAGEDLRGTLAAEVPVGNIAIAHGGIALPLHLAAEPPASQRLSEEQVRADERDKCEEDIQDAIGNWGGPEREHYTQAMQRSIDAIRKRARGLDLWGRPIQPSAEREAAPQPTENERYCPYCWIQHRPEQCYHAPQRPPTQHGNEGKTK